MRIPYRIKACSVLSDYLYCSRLQIVELKPKPSKEHLEQLHGDLLKDEMRMERNRLLKGSDYTVLPDYPSSNKQVMSEYRQQLRDFPTVWSARVPFPEKPVYDKR